jgi:hypothetical protein
VESSFSGIKRIERDFPHFKPVLCFFSVHKNIYFSSVSFNTLFHVRVYLACFEHTRSSSVHNSRWQNTEVINYFHWSSSVNIVIPKEIHWSSNVHISFDLCEKGVTKCLYWSSSTKVQWSAITFISKEHYQLPLSPATTPEMLDGFCVA